MTCFLCRSKPASVCPDCVAHNVQRFNDRIAALSVANKQSAQEIANGITHRLKKRDEIDVSLQLILRETMYTRELVRKGQHQLDEMRDRLTQRKRVLEESYRRMRIAKNDSVNVLKTQNKLKRKAWRVVFERIVRERQRAVHESISLHCLRPLVNSSRSIAGSEPCFYEIYGLPLSSIFCLRDYPADHTVQVVSHVANLTLHLAHYLGVKLPHEIVTCSSSALRVSIEGTDTQESLTGLESDPHSFARALALLVVNIQYLCRGQGVEVRAEEEDLGRLLYALLATPTLGQNCDDVAYSAALDKDKRYKIKRATNWDIEHLSKRIADDMTTDPFEFVERQLEQSEASTRGLKT